MEADRAASNPLFELVQDSEPRQSSSASLTMSVSPKRRGPRPPEGPPPAYDDQAGHATFDRLRNEAAMKHDALAKKGGAKGKTNLRFGGLQSKTGKGRIIAVKSWFSW